MDQPHFTGKTGQDHYRTVAQGEDYLCVNQDGSYLLFDRTDPESVKNILADNPWDCYFVMRALSPQDAADHAPTAEQQYGRWLAKINADP